MARTTLFQHRTIYVAQEDLTCAKMQTVTGSRLANVFLMQTGIYGAVWVLLWMTYAHSRVESYLVRTCPAGRGYSSPAVVL